MKISDDDLRVFEAMRCAPMPEPVGSGVVENLGAKIWYGRYGAGPALQLMMAQRAKAHISHVYGSHPSMIEHPEATVSAILAAARSITTTTL